MATTVLGKTRFDIKGTWSSGTATYRTDDIVFYNGGWYIATAATIAAGTLPTNASFWAPYRVSFNYRGTHVNTTGTVYKAYDTVLYTVQNTNTTFTQLRRPNLQAYVCIADHTADGTNTYLPLSATYWQPITSQGQRIGTSITVGTATSLDVWGVYGNDPRKIPFNGMANKGRVWDSTDVTINPYYARGSGKSSTDAYQGTHYITGDGGVGMTGQAASSGSPGHGHSSDLGPQCGTMSFIHHDWWRSTSNGGSGVHSTPDNNPPRAVQIERGWDHGTVLFNNGEVHSWGIGNSYGHGDRSTTVRYQPVRCGGTYTEVAIAANTTTHTLRNVKIVRISQSSAGNTCSYSSTRHTLALDDAGNVWAWGSNAYGQCGDNTTTAVQVPKQITSTYFNSRPVVAIWAFGGAYGWNFALNDQNQLFGWGYNGTGQLGNGTTTTSGVLVPTAITTQTWTVGNAGTIRKITSQGGQGTTAGAGCTAILTASGKIFVAGKQTVGQLMINSTTQTNSFTQCTSGPGAITGNGAYNVWFWGDPDSGMMVVRDTLDGTTWTAGYNGQYNLADGAGSTNSQVAVQSKKRERGAYSNITNIADFATLSGGSSGHSAMCVTDSGLVYGLGMNSSGQLAQGNAYGTAFTAPGDGNGIEHEASMIAWMPSRLPNSMYGKVNQVMPFGYKDNSSTNYGGFIIVSNTGRSFLAGDGSTFALAGLQVGTLGYNWSGNQGYNQSMFRALLIA